MIVLLSFDTEEFDVPREHGVDYSLEEGMAVSVFGTERILDVLKKYQVRATFFCTGNFAENAPDTIRRIKEEGHEIACHGVDHWNPKDTDVVESKKIVERVSGEVCFGYRQPRMFPVNEEMIERSGFLYNSSLNPAFIPGRYMHLNSPRRWFIKNNVIQIPASVTPLLRFPLFWLSLHNLPMWLYEKLVRRVLRYDGYFVTYFHPWEFFPLKDYPEFGLPFIITNNSGDKMIERLSKLISGLKNDNAEFYTFHDFINKRCIK